MADLIVGGIVAVIVFFVVRKLFFKHNGKDGCDGGCGCGCH